MDGREEKYTRCTENYGESKFDEKKGVEGVRGEGGKIMARRGQASIFVR